MDEMSWSMMEPPSKEQRVRDTMLKPPSKNQMVGSTVIEPPSKIRGLGRHVVASFTNKQRANMFLSDFRSYYEPPPPKMNSGCISRF